ncbi:MAG: aminotransferase class I/II-fold pyridoxal phosphate-dependent enzyme [Muribaculum sp.]|nr:aminotransferase class I/II-fold pyridoxal phosphate-dependent enzyme [Muribaculaceae bacterium]MCM1081589.1 aminotransferase class I/II-fold pyridoxal phosphate-dependent enzyme [Muribaculum sp.]
MQAIILAAGMGRRLGPLTADNTKCMVEVNGQCLIDRMLSQLSKLNLSKIVIITGYEGEKLRKHVIAHHCELKIEFVDNPVFEHTNNIYSLWLARDYMTDDDTLLLESDIIFDDRMLALACSCPQPDVALVDKYQPWMDGTMVQIDPDTHRIMNFIPKKAFRYSDVDTYYKTVNVYKISREFARDHYLPFLEAYIKVMGHNEYYEQVLRVITLIDTCPLIALPVDGHKWYEIDDVQDLRIAELIFSPAEERIKKLHGSYGGFWRYNGITDFCYLVNPYFPTVRMVDEMKSSFNILLRQYPSGSAINRMLAGKYFGISQRYVAVGNGAAELIKAVVETGKGLTGLVLPSFEEYYNRMDADKIVVFTPNNEDFRYNASDLMHHFGNRQLSRLLIVNPDNPSGNMIPRAELLELCEWTRKKNIELVIDESFVDFADGNIADNTLLSDIVLESYPHLVVIKSISKSYGVPGLRLGITASANTALVNSIQKNCAIWNINSFAEYYMQIFGKYESDYRRACNLIGEARQKFQLDLAESECLRPIYSQANYFLCQLREPYTAEQLSVWLLDNYGILIKNCAGKRGFPDGSQFVRVAVRDQADNNRFIEALSKFEKLQENV